MLTTTLNTVTFYSAALPVGIWYSSYYCCKSVHTNSRGQSLYDGDSTSISDYSVHEQASNIMPHLNTHTYIPKIFSLAPGPNCLDDVTGMSYTGSQSTSDDGLACLVWWPEFVEEGPLNETIVDAQNYCRNAAIFGLFSYAYLTDHPLCRVAYVSEEAFWRYCDIPLCSDVMTTQMPPAAATSITICKLLDMIYVGKNLVADSIQRCRLTNMTSIEVIIRPYGRLISIMWILILVRLLHIDSRPWLLTSFDCRNYRNRMSVYAVVPFLLSTLTQICNTHTH